MQNAETPEFPITLDERAVIQLKKLVAKDARPGVFLRVGVKGGGCSGLEYVLKLEEKRLPQDLSHSFQGVEVVCDSKSAKFLRGTVLEYTGNLIGGGFKFENPNAQRSCGCGSSFTPKTA